MTGWGQDGSDALRAGHDINYIALAGALEPVAAPGGGPPVPPLNMLGDFGGGGMLLVVGTLSALLHARASGHGQVVDAAIVEGTARLTAMTHAMRASGAWERRVFGEADGLVQPEPAPRLSPTPGARGTAAPLVGEHTEAVLADFGFSGSTVARLASKA
jgi:crotonobetainyl-CoA:carnitine CoA-transferase CaiB-like acyl-CoA transferase